MGETRPAPHYSAERSYMRPVRRSAASARDYCTGWEHARAGRMPTDQCLLRLATSRRDAPPRRSGRRRSAPAKDRVRSDPPPDHMRLTGSHLRAVLERRSTVRCPRHLPNPRMPLHALDPERRIEVLPASVETGDELSECGKKRALLLCGQSVPIAPKRREHLTRRHPAAWSARPAPLGAPHHWHSWSRGLRHGRCQPPAPWSATHASRTKPGQHRSGQR